MKVDELPFPPDFQPQILDLCSCRLGGGIPNFISNLTQLSSLSLANNNLSGTIPSWLFNLPNLAFLNLSSNNLQGVVPPQITLVHSYIGPTGLILSKNKFHGYIPSLLQNIDVVDLSGNSFTGSIPRQLGVQRIRYLSLSGNKIYGQIPSTFCPSDNVMMLLDLSNNILSGTVPTSLGNCTSLIYLNLGGNKFEGEIPNQLENAQNLSYLDISYNNFSGPFPYFFRKLQRLSILKLGNNRFQGRIPKFIGDIKYLRILDLQSNFFNDSIPLEINQLENIQYLDLSNNKLSGTILGKLHGLKMLTARPRDGNILGFVVSTILAAVELNMVTKGVLQQFTVVRTFHNGIDFSQNYLTGNIPSEIGHLQGLYMLNLSHNSLHGKIPISIGNMSGLESLDLSFNNLGGKIPTEMALLHALSTFNISYNNLSGKIPTLQHFDTLSVDGSAYIGNEFLCGAPLRTSCDNDSSWSSSRSADDMEDSLQNKMFYVIITIGYGVGLWGFFGVLYLIKDDWRRTYWRSIDLTVLRIIHSARRTQNKIQGF